MYLTAFDTCLSGSPYLDSSSPCMVLPPTRLLVVDEDHDSAHALALMALSRGFEVHVAYDEGEALAEIAEFRPIAILVAVGTFWEEGYVLARRLWEVSPESLLIAVTAPGVEVDEWLARWSGFEYHLESPTETEEMFDRVRWETVPVL